MWYNSSVFYQIFPLGFCGAPECNDGVLHNRLGKLRDWIPHLHEMGVNALYLCPVFESDTHGYDTRDYATVDRRLGSNDDFAALVRDLHAEGLRVVLDGVFHHVGRGFLAFQDVLQRRHDSPYRDWFYVRFDGDNPFHDGLSYEGWEGCLDLVKLNLGNADVQRHLFDCIRAWVADFDIDGLRLDVAYALDEQFLRHLSAHAHALKPDFLLVGETIHGDYRRIVGEGLLDSCTNYECFKGIHSSLNDLNLYEIAHSLNRQFGPDDWTIYKGMTLLNFVDNHDVTRIASNLGDPNHLPLAYALLYGMPGVPCLYYGSEWGEQAVKTPGSDVNLRPCFEQPVDNELSRWVASLSRLRADQLALREGGYRQLYLTNRQFAFLREAPGSRVVVAVNAEHEPHTAHLGLNGTLTDLHSGERLDAAALPLDSCGARFCRVDA